MKYFLILIGSFILSLLFVSTTSAKQNSDTPRGNAYGLAKQELESTQRTTGNKGSIWTTNSDGSQQDENHYALGEDIYLHGQNLPTGTLTYTIYTNPPSAKKGTVVATGTVNIPTSGDISPTLIWNIPGTASFGVYKVVLTTGSHKSDNFKIVKGLEEEEPPVPPIIPPVIPHALAQGGPTFVAQATVTKKLPATGPGNYLPFLFAIGLFLGLKKLLGKRI